MKRKIVSPEENRCVAICQILQRMMARSNENKEVYAEYIDALQRAPHYICELDPESTVKQIQIREKRDLAMFFEMPFDILILDYPELKKIWKNFWPFILLQRVNENRIYIHSLTPSHEITKERFEQDYVQPYLATKGIRLDDINENEKALYYNLTIAAQPISIDRFIIDKGIGGWHRATVGWDTYGNYSCPWARTKVGVPAENVADIPPFYHACNLQIPGAPDCKKNYDETCTKDYGYYQTIWELIYYSLVYINIPSNVSIEVTPRLSRPERRRFEKSKKPGDINPGKPQHYVVYYKDVKKMYPKKTGIAVATGTQRMPITAHWRYLEHERWTHKQFTWIHAKSRKEENPSWSDEHRHFKVIDPPGRKKF